MNDFQSDLQRRLETLRQDGLYRELRLLDSPQGVRVVVGGRELLNFSSNDYLGLANHPVLREAAARAVRQFGVGTGASRLICGSLTPHHELEEALAAWKNTEAALSFSTGYAAALGAITALLQTGDIVIVDKLVHACCLDAARLSGATLRVFGHNDLNRLEDILKWAARRRSTDSQVAGSRPRILIVTESVFSMDGDLAPLTEIAELKDRYGAWLMVDEAHATGLYGKRRSGLIEQLGLTGQVEVQMSTLGKALGASGGCICGSHRLMDFLVNRARSFIFSTAPVPGAAAAAKAGIEVVQSQEGETLCQTLWDRLAAAAHDVKRFPNSASSRVAGQSLTVSANSTPGPSSAILPLMIGDERATMKIAERLRERGFLVPGIRYPTVARGAARLRVTLSAAHSEADVAALVRALNETVNEET